LKKQVSLLIELQKLDDEIRRETVKKTELPERIRKMKEEILFRETLLEEKKGIAESLQRSLKENENELKKLGDTLRKVKDRLFEVKTNKEYQAMLKEMDAITEASDAAEDNILRYYDQVDASLKALDQAKTEYETNQRMHEGEIGKIEGEIAMIDGILKEIQEKYTEVRGKIRPDLIRRFDLIGQKRNGKAVVSVWREICGGCHMNIPPQLYNNLRKYEDIILCPHCNRIIYWEDRSDEGV